MSLFHSPKTRTIRASAAALTAIGCLGFSASQANAIHLDFDTDAAGNPIVAGQIIDDEYAAWGVTIKAEVEDKRDEIAIAFDSENPSGGDDDLGTGVAGYNNSLGPQGNILILSEDGPGKNGLVEDPDDNNDGGYFDFIFDTVRSGGDFVFLDLDDNVSNIKFYLDGKRQDKIRVFDVGDNAAQTIVFDDSVLYDKIRFDLDDNGAIVSATFGDAATSAIPEPVTAALAFMSVGALGISTLRRPRKA